MRRPRLIALLALAVIVVLQPVAQPEEGRDFGVIVRQAKEKVFPAVVYLRCVVAETEGGRRSETVVGGSGVLISPEGELLTNWHVVERAREVRCLLHDGRAFRARVVGADKDTDVALVRLEAGPAEEPFPAATLGDSDALVEGDFVMAMGAPWGMSRSVSIGIVSCTRRYLPGHSEYSLWIQTDASISPGNSGGPLVSTAGTVVGLNARGSLFGGDLGFAIPASTLRLLTERFRAHGEARWSWTGLRLQPLRSFDSDTWFEGRDGVIVTGTEPDSPAEATGLQAQDRLVALNGQRLDALTSEDLPAVNRALSLLPLDRPARLRVRRGERVLELDLTPRVKGVVVGEELALKRWDISVKTINRFERPDLYRQRSEGIFVHGVTYPGNGSASGLRSGDILLKAGTTPIQALDDLEKAHAAALAANDAPPRLVLTILRNRLLRQVVLDWSRDYERK